MSGLKRALRYLRGSVQLGISFHADGKLIIFSDADCETSLIDRRSISGYVSFFTNGPVSWSSRKQPTVALSTMEAEFIALARETCEAI
jgi:hypothetical protein